MMEKIDITYTTKPSDRPHPDARLLKDLDTGIAEWSIPEEVEIPEFLKPKPKAKKGIKNA